ncbi:leucine-rich repeat-containing protein 57-like isoform X1 [Biomphalaria glabrata]|uniref:Leucine-rich repeat-containing protein 57-like isoform X1 n=1 Tax=Biomphalaria glabrata TaxID=6526 RepID=A0A2C9K6Y4_BIOGL|nr:leucine-rich repeat-containing protein 57-like isoform X1 [Biomphalaria glabrata]KAI8788690.1 leucine-rich repeat-containing protein 57 isoform X1 [Biomphalaria glabrata]
MLLCCFKTNEEQQDSDWKESPNKGHGSSSFQDSRHSSESLKRIMGNSNLKQHIETAQKTGVCQLRHMTLKEVPEELQKLSKNLRTVDLSDNKITHLPPWFTSMTTLKNFTLNNGTLVSLPEDFGKLKKLEVLCLNSNSLSSLPSSFPNLTNLKTLSLSGNHLKQLPSELLSLPQLDVVDLSQNSITKLPQDMSGLQAVELNLNQNQITKLPESIAKCPRLKVLRLEENCLEISAFTPEIMKTSKISLFAVEGNMFDMKLFHQLDGYDEYMERFTATKKKFN